MSLTRILGVIAAAASSLQLFLLSYPGDLVGQGVLIVVGAVAVSSAAAVAFLKAPE